MLGSDSSPAYAPAVALASVSPLADAQAALSRIDIVVARNDTLERIFRRLKLDLSDLASMRSLPGVRDALDSLRPGEALRVTHKDGSLYGLERRLNETQTLRVSRDPTLGLKADVLQNPLETRTRTVQGVIDSSLFEAVEAAGAHDQTAVTLADIFGWDIDFVLDVRQGDTFIVTYPEYYRDGVYVKDGPIEAAAFVNHGREFKAVRYTDPEGSSHYYTPDGRSLHKAFLRAPVEFTRVSSRFNSARLHPILNRIRAHQGVEFRYAASMIWAARRTSANSASPAAVRHCSATCSATAGSTGAANSRKTTEPPPSRSAASAIRGSHRLPAHSRHRSTNAQ